MKRNSILAFLCVLMFTILFLTVGGCGPVKLENVVNVEPNETAFMISLEDDNQGKFESIKYLEGKKVAAKRILLPQREQSLGRGSWNYRWIPTARVIKVDRSLVSRKWVGDPKTASSPETSPLEVESLDSIGFAVGVTITARIDESDAAKFLYFHSGKQLSEVIDTNIKSFILAKLSTEFGAVPLTACRNKKNEIFSRVTGECKNFFKERGITIEYMGLSEGLTYLNPKVQETIDNSFIAEQSKVTAQQEQEAQTIKNATAISKAKAEAEVARALASNLGAVKAKLQLEIETKKLEIWSEAFKKWNGELPPLLPDNNPFVTQFFSAFKKMGQ